MATPTPIDTSASAGPSAGPSIANSAVNSAVTSAVNSPTNTMMPPPTPRSSGRPIKPTLKLRGVDEDDDDDGAAEDGEESGASGRFRRPSRTRVSTLRSVTSASSQQAGSTSAIRARRLRLNINAEQRLLGRGDPTYAGANKTTPYMQGYDRELDSSDDEAGEGMAFEEQIILRMPENHATTKKLSEWVRKRDAGTEGREVELKFKDSRRAVFKVGEQLMSAKLVDLPAIIESHKTLDNKQLFKISDISQMLLVTHSIDEEADVTKPDPQQVEGLADNFVYDHGITPPMRWARKRRFRKRIHKRTIETVEKEVERLLAEDERAEKVEYQMIDVAEADMSDSDGEGGHGQRRRERDSSMMEDGASTLADGEERSVYDDFEERSMMADDDDDVDRDLQRELEQEMLLQQQDEEEEEYEDDEDDGSSTGRRRRRARSTSRATSDDDDDEDEDDEDEDEDDLFDAGNDDEAQTGAVDAESGERAADDDDDDLDEEEAEMRVREHQLEAECREIEGMVKRKQAEVDGTANALIKQRNAASLKRIQAELDMKRTQLQDLKQQRREGKEAAKAEAEAQAQAEVEAAAAAAATAAANATAEEGEAAGRTQEGEIVNADVSQARAASSMAPSANATASSANATESKPSQGSADKGAGLGAATAAPSSAGARPAVSAAPTPMDVDERSGDSSGDEDDDDDDLF